MRLVGLTGGIGAGKSTVARLFEQRGAIVVDADAVVRDLQRAGSPLLARLAQRFGADIVAADGELDRAALAAVAFADDTALADLNAIVHPAVREEMDRRVADHLDTDRVVVLDVPLLDVRAHGDLAAVVVVDAPVDVAVARLVGERGMDEADARARIAKQISRDERRALATHVIDNSGDRDALVAQVDAIWAEVAGTGPAGDQKVSTPTTSPWSTSPVGSKPSRA